LIEHILQERIPVDKLWACCGRILLQLDGEVVVIFAPPTSPPDIFLLTVREVSG